MWSSKTDFVCTLLIYILWRDTYTKPLSSWSQFQITTAVPQLEEHKAEVRMALGQALENERKYESDLKVGKRTTKKTRKEEVAEAQTEKSIVGYLKTKDETEASENHR